ncbi:MAG: hypothetical protein L0241_08675, partial [Planctomycetia bacterium]|nr:hypothetical protein [Planctomycetia bacterium]
RIAAETSSGPAVGLLGLLNAKSCRVTPAAVCAVSVDEASGWSVYLVWLRACWQGRVVEVLAELDTWQERLGEPPAEDDDSGESSRDPRRVVYQARTCLRNNQQRMAYPRYHREGLPTTSSLVESLVGEVNARVKSKQKYWTRLDGCESILQLRAAVLSQDDRLSRFFAQRPGCPFRKRQRVNSQAESLAAQTAAWPSVEGIPATEAVKLTAFGENTLPFRLLEVSCASLWRTRIDLARAGERDHGSRRAWL